LAEIEKELEDYFGDLQKLVITFGESKKSPLAKVLSGKITKKTFYEDKKQLEKLESELSDMLNDVVSKSGNRGKIMAKGAMDKFLSKMERRSETVKRITAIDKLSERQIKDRIKLYEMQLKREVNNFSGLIDEYKLNAKISGMSSKEILEDLVKAAQDEHGIAIGFEKRVRRVTLDAARREAQEQAQAEYMKAAKPSEQWQWITVSTKPCPDCVARAGAVGTLEYWRQLGTPGTGKTICGHACLCQIVPVSVADDLFPDVKEFKWDKDNLVLTSAKDANTLKSKAHRK
jgi:NTP pyrophosphatase (non-canonical NTP hydrolase)